MFKSYLEFGEKNNSDYKKIYDLKTGFQAYEWFMNSRYFNDIICYKNMLKMIEKNKNINEIFDYYNANIHHKDDICYNLKKLLALDIIKGNSFLEIGSSLFGCIDGMLVCKNILKKFYNIQITTSLNRVNWYGVDISEFMNQIAKIIYQNYNIKTKKFFDDIFNSSDVFFAKGISLLYAIKNLNALEKIIQNNKICLFDYSFSLNKRQQTTIGTGIATFYLTLEECLPVLENNKVIYVNTKSKGYKNKDKIFLDMVIGKERDVKNFVKMTKQVNNISYFVTEWKPLKVILDDVI